MSQRPAKPTESLAGSVERITFHSEESGFCVLRAKVKGHRDVVTVIGKAASINAGEYIDCQGHWHNDKKHGLQFRTQSLKVVPPSTKEGMEKYLGSGMVKGIGPHFAKKLVCAFGESVFDVIEHESDRLLELDGIGKKRKAQVTKAWAEQKAIRNIMVFLQSHGVGSARAVRIYKTYGDAAIELVRENPYRLALDIRGIGFKTADQIAEHLGVEKDSLLRAQAGVRHVLQTLCDNGHCAALRDQLIKASVKLLEIDAPIIEQAIVDQLKEEHIIADTINGQTGYFPAALYHAEVQASQHIKRLQQGKVPWGHIDQEKAIPWVEGKNNIQLSPSQHQAIATILNEKVAIMTGGPGVGKTTIVSSLLKIIQAKGVSIALAAPTGRAAKRLTETTGLPAKTIHRLLEFDPKTFSFQHQVNNPLSIQLLVIDEASMIDITLLFHLLKAIPDEAAVLFVGDIDQLPSVGSGAVLSDLIVSKEITTVRLTEIFRQAKSSQIIVNAHRINAGQMPLPTAKDSDFYVVYTETPEEAHDQLLELVSKRLPAYLNCDSIADIQVLTPMNRGGLGSRGLNVDLQALLNGKSEPIINRYGSNYAPNDKVIQMVNNYDKEVFNGDIGVIESVHTEDSTLRIRFDQRTVNYEFNELDELQLAYAISIHKSQGSEFSVVVLPMVTAHYTLLARNLLYTGMTRGKRLVVLVGQKKAIGMAVRNNEQAGRLTKLAERLQENSHTESAVIE